MSYVKIGLTKPPLAMSCEVLSIIVVNAILLQIQFHPSFGEESGLLESKNRWHKFACRKTCINNEGNVYISFNKLGLSWFRGIISMA